ncbi:hypothetical protein BDK51DRAFT_33983 [Blyttiomyces helicus]|uniref:Uncharacterized protein n=1 Tax=Blyttiomyces helicus TaxID=388810 RepID=A0A4P9VZZ9_9FUNG|nr:hypothetical protein BDK51DRAFT_33983 [Blyttiomyces helicus]|eukprot:RKO84625.1 hypothetical protein BDK51DRAFT_33983 [Blyttiomyces helicus]
MKWWFRIYCILTGQNGKYLAKKIQKILEKKLRLVDINGKLVEWSKVVDTSVYSTGLRMLGSLKNTRKVKVKESEKYRNLLPIFSELSIEPPFGLNPAESDSGSSYRVTKINGKDDNIAQDIAIEHMEMTSIRYNLIGKSDNDLVVVGSSMSELETLTVDIPDCQRSSNVGKALPEELQQKIKPFIRDHFHHHFSRIGKMKIKEAVGEKKYIYIQLIEKYCQIQSKSHSSNNQYVVIGQSAGESLYMEQRCHDEGCYGQNILPTKVPKIMQDLLVNYFPWLITGMVTKDNVIQQSADLVQHIFPRIPLQITPFVQKTVKHPDTANGSITIPQQFSNVKNYFIVNVSNINIICNKESPDPLNFIKDNFVYFEEDPDLNYSLLDALGGTHNAIAQFMFDLKKDEYG